MSKARHGQIFSGQIPAILNRFGGARAPFGALARRFAAEAERRHMATKIVKKFCAVRGFIGKRIE
jgi:hypothetical protein